MPIYNISSAFRVSGDLNISCLADVLNHVVSRHESLRTTFRQDTAGNVQQVVHASMPGVLEILGHSEIEKDPRAIVAELVRHSFDLEKGPLMKVFAVDLAEGNWIIVINLHHIVADGQSLGLLSQELTQLYGQYIRGEEPNLPDLRFQYPDYTMWEYEWFETQDYQQDLDYWLETLAGDIPVLQLPTDRPRPSRQHFVGSWIPFRLEANTAERLQRLARKNGVSMYVTLLTVFYVLLHRYTRQDDILVGTPFLNRQLPDLNNVIGFFANTIVNRTNLEGAPTFEDLLQRVKKTVDGSTINGSVPFERLVEVLNVDRDASHNPLFQVMFTLQEEPLVLRLGDLDIERERVDNGTSKFDLLLETWPEAGGIGGRLEYSSDLFDRDTVERMALNYSILAASAGREPTVPVGQLSMLSADEVKGLERMESGAKRTVSAKNLAKLFEQRAVDHPDVPAVETSDGKTISYKELNCAANQLAWYLLELGIDRNESVAIYASSSFNLCTAILGTLKAGAGYVPLDPSYPDERLRYMLEDSGASVVICDGPEFPCLDTGKYRLLKLADDNPDLRSKSTDNPNREIDHGDLAYILYTSGSTGRPKGVAMENGPLVNLVEWQINESAEREGGRTLQYASPSFDVSFLELFATWGSGGTTVLIDEAARLNMEGLIRRIEERQITRLILPFVVLQHLATAAIEVGVFPASLREVVSTAEQLKISPTIKTFFQRLPECRLVNEYGPTESHVVTSFALPERVETWVSLPSIGTPIANATVVVLDEYCRRVPVGVPGELYIGGRCLAREYVNKPEMTADRFRFVDNLGSHANRLYRSGDLARWHRDGTLEYLGRIDGQLKIRGFRVEPGEIEAALAAHSDVAEAAVVGLENESSDRVLVAFARSEPGSSPQEDELRSMLRLSLPDYLVPSRIVIRDTLPMTPNGKIDRKSLLMPEEGAQQSASAGPRDDVEKGLSEIWTSTLGVSRVGIFDDFFSLGGHSLIATKLVLRANERFGVDLPLVSVFEHSSVADMAAVIRSHIESQNGRQS